MLPTLSEENKTKASALIAAVLVITAGFLVYRNFSRIDKEITRKEADLSTGVADKRATPEALTIEPKADGSVAGVQDVFGTGGETNVWQPREISQNSLVGVKQYTVQSGDTLWEIAKGRYGSGFEWGRILAANKDKIGILADGSQALITPGQVLVLAD